MQQIFRPETWAVLATLCLLPTSVQANTFWEKSAIPTAFSLSTSPLPAGRIKGKVIDAQTGEEVIGAYVYLKSNKQKAAVTGLDGSFSLEADQAGGTVVCTCVGYRTKELTIDEATATLTIPMEELNVSLGEAVVSAHNPGRTEAGARDMERRAINVVNIMSAKAIELSPDLTVANALGRVSGITLERSASGEGQYAILRGMDKRYNYTLVNGVKIPSPDNKNRFVPLDIFPAEMLDRLEVYKSLTADLEGDGIGGAVNMVMKDAPDRRQLTFNAGGGYSFMYFDRKFDSFVTDGIQKQSPNERLGQDHRVSMQDFTLKNLATKRKSFVPDFIMGVSYGDRFFHQRLGLMVAVSGQNIYRGKNSDIYAESGVTNIDETTTERTFSEQQTRLGAHLNLDYALARHHKLALYSGYMYFRNQQVRDTQEKKAESVRLRLNQQGIFNTTLTGEHRFGEDEALHLTWRGVYSKATNRTPDNAEIHLTTASTGLQTVSVNPAAVRRWEHNDDEDKAGYADLSYHFAFDSSMMDLKAGGMYRDKKRGSFFNEYTFKPSQEQRGLVRYKDWNNFDEIQFEAPRFGNLSDPLNYDATERVGAAYLMDKIIFGKWELTVGLRAEHTDQGYYLKFPTEGARNEGRQRYWDILPDFHAKYSVHANANLRFSYARAINRPSFFEIVPYNIIGEDYKERGNPDIRHTVADNFDVRYEWFPTPSEQVMAGLFYKRLQDPIEYGMETSGQDTYYTPANFGTAHNMGLEADVTKYFRHWGIRANYTYTYSRIRTNKTIEEPNPDPNAETSTVTRTVSQTRPLFGQAAHVVNLSLLYKDTEHGWDAQLAFNYTGKRLCIVSRFLDNDSWNDGYPQLDFSMEKTFGQTGWSLFAKANNLINLPMIQYVKRNSRNENLTDAERHKGGLLERKEWYGQSFVVGVRFKLL